MKIQLVIFDMDGLIFDTERIYYRAWQEAAKAYQYPMNFEIYKCIVARNSAYIIKELKEIWGEEAPVEIINEDKRARSLQIIEEEGLKLKEGVFELLEALEQKGIKKALATSSAKTKVKKFLELAKLEDRFDTLICGDDVKESKPNPEIFLKAANQMGVKPEACLVLEDAKFGLIAAKRGNMHSIWVPDLIKDDEEMEELATKVASSLKEVMRLID